MPELPEVETIRKQLAKKLNGKKLNGKEIVGVRRRAKILIIVFADKTALLFHLKLTGQLIFNGTPGKYTRQVFNFSDGSRLLFNDKIRFGWWKYVKDIESVEEIKKLGPEPLKLNFQDFAQNILLKHKATIKPLLMDQSFISGIGNIYADEILFAARIRPNRKVGGLTKGEIKAIFENMIKILQAAIKEGGSSVRDYIDAKGGQGGYKKYHKVYQRTDKPCFKCATPIERIKLGSRSAHYCPKCQK